MMKYLLLIALLLSSFTSHAFEQGQLKDNMYLYQSSEDFSFTKEYLEMAITNRGLLVSGTLHVEEMLARTGPDLDFEQPYIKAESIEFCSALLSHKMTQLDPVNMAVCPFTIALFIKKDEPDTVYVAFRKIYLAGDNSAELTDEIEHFLHGIVKEGLELN
jgi:hypothetical protein